MSRAPQTNERAGAALRPLTFNDHLSITGASTSVVAETRKATSTSLGLKLVRGHLAGPAVLGQLVAELLTFRKVAHAGPLDGGDMDEGVLAAVVRLNETETLGGVEPLHCAVSHDELLFPCVEDRSNADAPSEVISRVLGRGHQRVRGAGASPHGGLNEQPKIDRLDLGLMRPDVKAAKQALLNRALSLLRHDGPQLLLPALDQVGPGQERAVQRVERHGHDLDVGRVHDHDLHRGIRVGTVHREGDGEQVVRPIVLGVGLYALHFRHLDVPVEVGDRARLWLDPGRIDRCRLGLALFALRPLDHAALPLVLAASSQDRRRRRATGGGRRAKAGGAASNAIAAEARDIVRRAAGDVAGKTVAAQVRQAARHLGYAADDWRVREAWYGRAGAWSAAALDELRRRHAAWREREGDQGSAGLEQRVASVLRRLARLKREVVALEAEVGRLLVTDGEGAADA